MGRRKIEMEMVKDSNTRQVTFSKRRNGVFKKANELSTMCGVDVAVMVFSPGGRPYSYGNPSVSAVVDRYLSPDGSTNQTPKPSVKNANAKADPRRARREAVKQARIEKSQAQLDSITASLETEKIRGEALKMKLKETCEKNNIKDVKDLNMDELSEFKSKLDALREMIKGRVVEMEASSTLLMLSRDRIPIDDEPAEASTSTENKTKKRENKKKNKKN